MLTIFKLLNHLAIIHKLAKLCRREDNRVAIATPQYRKWIATYRSQNLWVNFLTPQ